MVFPYAFCGAILCEVDTSTSSIVVPVNGPCFEYPRAFQSERYSRWILTEFSRGAPSGSVFIPQTLCVAMKLERWHESGVLM